MSNKLTLKALVKETTYKREQIFIPEIKQRIVGENAVKNTKHLVFRIWLDTFFKKVGYRDLSTVAVYRMLIIHKRAPFKIVSSFSISIDNIDYKLQRSEDMILDTKHNDIKVYMLPNYGFNNILPIAYFQSLMNTDAIILDYEKKSCIWIKLT